MSSIPGQGTEILHAAHTIKNSWVGSQDLIPSHYSVLFLWGQFCLFQYNKTICPLCLASFTQLMFLKFIHSLMYKSSWLICILNSNPLFGCTKTDLPFHLLMDIWVTSNVQICVETYILISFWKMPRSELLGHSESSCLTLRETAQLFLKVLNAILHSHQQCMRVPLALLSVFYISALCGCIAGYHFNSGECL